jgi:hypothetical protein
MVTVAQKVGAITMCRSPCVCHCLLPRFSFFRVSLLSSTMLFPTISEAEFGKHPRRAVGSMR